MLAISSVQQMPCDGAWYSHDTQHPSITKKSKKQPSEQKNQFPSNIFTTIKTQLLGAKGTIWPSSPQKKHSPVSLSMILFKKIDHYRRLFQTVPYSPWYRLKLPSSWATNSLASNNPPSTNQIILFIFLCKASKNHSMSAKPEQFWCEHYEKMNKIKNNL